MILMYHRIAAEAYDPWGLAVPAERFAEQLDWLKQNRNVMPLAELAKLHMQGNLPSNACAITFDDGYACNADIAAPLLAKKGLSATFFLASRLLDPDREFWWDDLERIVLGSKANELSLGVADHTQTFLLGEPNAADQIRKFGQPPETQRQAALDTIWAELLPLASGEIASRIDALRAQAGLPKGARPSHRPMSREQAAALPAGTISIGGHTLHHLSLPDRPKSEREEEITVGLRECEAFSGQPVSCFAYPYGHHDGETGELVAAAGLACACTTTHGAITKRTDPLFLPRIQMLNWSRDELAHELAHI